MAICYFCLPKKWNRYATMTVDCSFDKYHSRFCLQKKTPSGWCHLISWCHDNQQQNLLFVCLQEISKDPQLFVGGASRFDVKQGELGEFWALPSSLLCPNYLKTLTVKFASMTMATNLCFGCLEQVFLHGKCHCFCKACWCPLTSPCCLSKHRKMNRVVSPVFPSSKTSS